MDTYQPIYDAVRSKIHGGNVGDAVESAIRNMNLSHYVEMAMETVKEAAMENCRPCILFKPELSKDGNMWCALYGDDLQSGIAGFGETPDKAMRDFDHKWLTEKTNTEDGRR